MKLINKYIMFATLCFGSSLVFAQTSIPVYNISTLLDMSIGSAFAKQNCPLLDGNYTCFIEGSARDIFDNLYVTTVLPKGQIFKVTPSGQASLYATFDTGNENPLAMDENYASFRVTIDVFEKLYVSFRAVDINQNPTDMNGIWSVPPGGGHCSLDSSNTCTKIFPAIGQTTNPIIGFPDSILLDHQGNMYLADPQMGNIWKINLSTKNGTLWAGTDAGSNPNYLIGNPVDIVLGSPQSNRGFGIVGLAYDGLHNMLYGGTYDTGSVVAIPVMPDGSAGTQSVSLNLSANDEQIEAVHIVNESNGRKLLVGHTLTDFVGYAKYIGCQQGLPGFCPAPFVQPSYGQEILSANLEDPAGLDFQTLINDPQLKIPSSFVNGASDRDTLYINTLGQLDMSGSKILKATQSR